MPYESADFIPLGGRSASFLGWYTRGDIQTQQVCQANNNTGRGTKERAKRNRERATETNGKCKLITNANETTVMQKNQKPTLNANQRKGRTKLPRTWNRQRGDTENRAKN